MDSGKTKRSLAVSGSLSPGPISVNSLFADIIPIRPKPSSLILLTIVIIPLPSKKSVPVVLLSFS